MNSRRAIGVYRNNEGECLFQQQALKMHHVIYKMLTILKVWKLEGKTSSTSSKRKTEEVEIPTKKNKKRRGKKQFKSKKSREG